MRGNCPDRVLQALLAGQNTTPDSTSGRGTVYRFSLASGSGIVREYRRGGLLRHVNRGAFLANRPLAELRLVDYLWRAGFPVPEPLGACWWRSKGLLHGCIATKALEAKHLQEYLATVRAPSPEVMRRVGEVIRKMHALGVRHGDLQVRNILIAGEMPYLIDFDKARRPWRLMPWSKASNLFRLRRSFDKNRIDSGWFHTIVSGYGPIPCHGFAWLVYKARGALSGVRFRR